MILLRKHSLDALDVFKPETMQLTLAERQSTATITAGPDAPAVKVSDAVGAACAHVKHDVVVLNLRPLQHTIRELDAIRRHDERTDRLAVHRHAHRLIPGHFAQIKPRLNALLSDIRIPPPFRRTPEEA